MATEYLATATRWNRIPATRADHGDNAINSRDCDGRMASSMQERSMAVSFTAHPRDVGETYGEHFGVAMRFSLAMIVAAGASTTSGMVVITVK